MTFFHHIIVILIIVVILAIVITLMIIIIWAVGLSTISVDLHLPLKPPMSRLKKDKLIFYLSLQYILK